MSTATLTPEADAVVASAMKLSAAEREVVARRLLASIDLPPNSYESPAALRAELQRRWDAIQRGEMKTYTIQETMAHLRKSLADGDEK